MKAMLIRIEDWLVTRSRRKFTTIMVAGSFVAGFLAMAAGFGAAELLKAIAS